MFAGCGSPWKKPCRKIISIHVSAIRYARSRRSSSENGSVSTSASCVPCEPLERQHARPRVHPVDLRHAHVRVAREVAVERLRVPALEPVVELLADLPRELVDERVRVDEVERAHALLHELRRLVEQHEVGLDLPRRTRALDLDRDELPVRERRAVHLADRRRRDRRRIEVEEEALDRVAEIFLDHALGLLERERPHVVLEAAQLGDDVRRHDVGTRREQLPELHERRAELVEELTQMLAARRRCLRRRPRRAAPRRSGPAAGRSACAPRGSSRSRAAP